MKPEVRIFHDLEALSLAAAEIFADQARQSFRERGRFLVALHGGSTPVRLFHLLATDFREQVDWQSVQVFWGDERCVPPDDPDSNYRQAHDLLLNRLSLPDANVHRIRGELGAAEAAKAYARTLKNFSSPPYAWPHFDLVYLGMGEDGHTASLFPGSPVEMAEPVLAVTAHYQDRPANRVTLTPVVFNRARMVAFMATGESKATALAAVLSDTHTRNPALFPAQRIQPEDGRLVWLVDEAAASRLPQELQ
jgi:6-phosphogluconolactonase